MSMSVGQRMHFAEMLRRGREECLLTLAAANAVAAGRSRRRAATRAAADAFPALEAALRERQEETLVAIAEAQHVMRDVPEMFGVCEECGEAISVARLDAAPWTTRCERHALEIDIPVC